MTKRRFLTTASVIAILSISLTACGTRTGKASNNVDVYIETDNRAPSSIFTSSDDYEPGNGGRSENIYAAVNDYVLTAFGMTYPEVDALTNYDIDTLHTLDNSPDRYGMEYQNNGNCTYIFHKEGNDNMGDNDRCVGAAGWFSRIMIFDHEWAAYVTDLNNALKEIYPDCSDIYFTDTYSIADAPINIGDTLAYMDFTVPFYNTAPTKVRLYVEASSASSIVSSDDWALLCLPNEY